MKKAVIFDLDGTLTDTLDSIKKCADAAIAVCGYEPYERDAYKYFVGEGAARLVEKCLIGRGDVNLENFDKVFAAYKEIFAENCMYHVRPYEGIRELLESLKDAGLKIAVLSNKPHAETIDVVESIFGKGYFDVIHGQKPKVERKPSPAGVFCILEELGLSVDEIAYLGDTSTDMQTGKSAGAFTVGALWGFRDRKELEENHADAIIKNPGELLDYVL